MGQSEVALRRRNGLIVGCLSLNHAGEQAWKRTVSNETKFQSVTIFRVCQRTSKLYSCQKYTTFACFPILWICRFVWLGFVDLRDTLGRASVGRFAWIAWVGWVDPRPPADPSFVLDPPSTASSGPFKNHLTCTGWLATHLAQHSITVYPYPAVSNDRPGDPVLPKIWSLLTFLMLMMMIMMTKIMRRMMIAIESAQSTKETGQQPAAPDGPHTSPLTHTLAHVSTYTHFYLHLHLHTHLHIHLPIHTYTHTHTLAPMI